MKQQFETDSQGDVVLKPVTGWKTAPVAGVAILLAIEYVSTPEELETEDQRQAIQFVLTPLKCLELAESLKKQATRLIESPLPPGTVRH